MRLCVEHNGLPLVNCVTTTESEVDHRRTVPVKNPPDPPRRVPQWRHHASWKIVALNGNYLPTCCNQVKRPVALFLCNSDRVLRTVVLTNEIRNRRTLTTEICARMPRSRITQ
jgi:hypothetical protein